MSTKSPSRCDWGKFIVLEGIDGSGKSTQAGLLTPKLFASNKNNDVFLTREPTRRTSELRETLTKPQDPSEHLDFYTQFFITDRKMHLAQSIEPTLASGAHVVCDRYKYSTLAYQTAQGGNFEELVALHEGLRVPDLVLLLDLEVSTAQERRDGIEIFDTVGTEFQELIRANYRRAVQELSDPIVVIDATQSPEQVADQIWTEVCKIL